MKALAAALALAMPDGLTMPFAGMEPHLSALFSRFSVNPAYTAFFRQVRDASEAYSASIRTIRQTEQTQSRPALSPRERQIGLPAAEGHTNVQIAEVLHISPNTVKVDLKNLFSKLGIRSRALLNRDMF